jgi:hypothetical protein
MTWERTGISPFLEELIVKMDAFFELGQVRSPPHLTEEFSFVKFEGLTLFKIITGLDRPDSETEFRESVTISIGDMEMNSSLHRGFLISGLTVNQMGLDFKSPIPISKRLQHKQENFTALLRALLHAIG